MANQKPDLEAFKAMVYALSIEEIVDKIMKARERKESQQERYFAQLITSAKLEWQQHLASERKPKVAAMKKVHDFWIECREGNVRGLKPNEENFEKKFVIAAQVKWPILESAKHLRERMRHWERKRGSSQSLGIKRPIPEMPREHLLTLSKRELFKELGLTMAETGRHRMNRALYEEKNAAAQSHRSKGGLGRSSKWDSARELAKRLQAERDAGRHPKLRSNSDLIDKVREIYPKVAHSTISRWFTQARKKQ